MLARRKHSHLQPLRKGKRKVDFAVAGTPLATAGVASQLCAACTVLAAKKAATISAVIRLTSCSLASLLVCSVIFQIISRDRGRGGLPSRADVLCKILCESIRHNPARRKKKERKSGRIAVILDPAPACVTRTWWCHTAANSSLAPKGSEATSGNRDFVVCAIEAEHGFGVPATSWFMTATSGTFLAGCRTAGNADWRAMAPAV